MSLACHIGIHKWSTKYRIFVGAYPVGVGWGAANGYSVFLAPCTRAQCTAWKREEFYEPFDHWTDALPKSGNAVYRASTELVAGRTARPWRKVSRRITVTRKSKSCGTAYAERRADEAR